MSFDDENVPSYSESPSSSALPRCLPRNKGMDSRQLRHIDLCNRGAGDCRVILPNDTSTISAWLNPAKTL